MTIEARIRIALVVALLVLTALVIFGATREVVVAPTAQEKAPAKGTAPTRSKSVDEACDEARIRLLTAKEEEFEPFERFNLEQAVEKLCD